MTTGSVVLFRHILVIHLLNLYIYISYIHFLTDFGRECQCGFLVKFSYKFLVSELILGEGLKNNEGQDKIKIYSYIQVCDLTSPNGEFVKKKKTLG